MSAPRSPGALRLELLLCKRGRLHDGARVQYLASAARGWWLLDGARAEWLGANEAAATRAILAAGEEAGR